MNPLELTFVRNLLRRGKPLPQPVRRQVVDISPLHDLEISDLDLSYTRVSNLTPLSEMSKLQLLNLAHTPVSDLASVAKLTNLQSLVLWATKCFITQIQ